MNIICSDYITDLSASPAPQKSAVPVLLGISKSILPILFMLPLILPLCLTLLLPRLKLMRELKALCYAASIGSASFVGVVWTYAIGAGYGMPQFYQVSCLIILLSGAVIGYVASAKRAVLIVVALIAGAFPYLPVLAMMNLH